MNTNQEVLVVGAGPVGLVAACELARQGVRARLIDALEAPTEQARAIVVQPRSQDLLATLGALPQMLQTALPQTHLELDARDGDTLRHLARIDLGDLPTRHPAVLNLPQTETEAALRARAADLDVTIERGVSLVALSQDGDGVDVTLRSAGGDEHARFGWVIGADGGHSTVRHAVGNDLQGSFVGSHFVLADVIAVTEMARDATRLFAGAGGLTVVLPMAAGRTRLMFQVPDPGPAAAAGPSVEQVEQLVRERLGDLLTIHDVRFPTYYSVHHAIVPNYRVGRVFLAGDAAHIHSPAAGQGMNTGMQDAANLAWKLAMVVRGRAADGLLDSYHAERHPVGAQVVQRTKLMADTMTRTGLAATVRNTAIAAAGHIRRFTDTLAMTFSELSVAYPKSPVVARYGHHAHGALEAGAHGPDIAGLTTPDGTTTWIGDLLARPGHLLLASTDDAAVVDRLRLALGDLGTVVPVVRSAEGAARDAIVDTAGEVGRQYGIGADGIALIRPDGYVGFLATPADDTALRSYLTDTLLVTPRAFAQS